MIWMLGPSFLELPECAKYAKPDITPPADVNYFLHIPTHVEGLGFINPYLPL